MSKCKICLQKFIHEVTCIIKFDCLDNYSYIQQTSTCKAGSAKTMKCTWSSRDWICSTFYFTNHLLNASLKRKTINILHHHTAYDYRKESKSRWYTTARCWHTTSKPVFLKIFTIPGLLPTNVAVYYKPDFQITRHFGRRHLTIGGLQTGSVTDTYCCT